MDTHVYKKRKHIVVATKKHAHLKPAVAIRWLYTVNCALPITFDWKYIWPTTFFELDKIKILRVEKKNPTDNKTNKNHHIFQINLC